jgi:CheY-like chemotaxis protein
MLMKGFRILIVEDEVLLQRVMEDAARLIGLPCEVVRTGQEALASLQRRDYDLLIQDVRLPDMSGAAVVQAVRQMAPTMPIILVTAYAINDETQQAIQHGVDAVLFKPFDINTLLTTARHLLLTRQAVPFTHAVVQMPTAPTLPAPMGGIEMPPTGAVVVLMFGERRLMGQVRAGNERDCAIETPADAEQVPRWVEVELTGRDALYRFRMRLMAYHHGTQSDRWLLHRPRRIGRFQRRREPRLPARGHAVVSAAGRLLRTVEGELLDLSAHGASIKLPVELNRGTRVNLLIEWHENGMLHTFQSEGIVRHTLALTEGNQPIYRLGVELVRVPRAIRALIRQRVHQHLTS